MPQRSPRPHPPSLAPQAQGGGLKFEAEATGHLQNQAVPLTDDAGKYGRSDVDAAVAAILTPSGFVESATDEDVVGVVLLATSFYAESGGQVRAAEQRGEGGVAQQGGADDLG